MNERQRLANGERGAVLVHVALAMLALIAFSAFAIDYGALLASRSQAQNSADSAALAGAISLAFDDPDDLARAQAAAAAAGSANIVLGAAPSILPATDVQLIPCPPGAPGLPDTCIRADVYRSVARSNALPTFFAQILDITSQDVRATATAQVLIGNAAECMKPWAIADKWDENWENGKPNVGPWTPDSDFDKYKKQGDDYVPDPTVTTPDVYIPPTANNPGTGFTPFDADGNPTPDYGLQMTLKIGASEDRLSSGLVPRARLTEPRLRRWGRQPLPLQHRELQPDRIWHRRLTDRGLRTGKHGRPDQAGRRRWRVGRHGAYREGSRRILERLYKIDSG